MLQHSVHLKPCQNYLTSEFAKYSRINISRGIMHARLVCLWTIGVCSIIVSKILPQLIKTVFDRYILAGLPTLTHMA